MGIGQSRQDFFDRWNVDEGQRTSSWRAETADIDGHIDWLLKTAPPWSKSTIRNTFVGHARALEPINAEVSSWGVPFINLYPRLGIALCAAVGLYEIAAERVRVLITETDGIEYRNDLSTQLAAATPAGVDLWARRLREITSGDLTIVDAATAAVSEDFDRLALLAANRWDQDLRRCFQFILCHEYSHILLGHVSGASRVQVQRAQETLATRVPDIVNAEIACDVMGLLVGLCPISTAHPDTFRVLTELARSLEAVGIVHLCLTTAGPSKFFVPVEREQGHPDSLLRYEAASRVIKHEFARQARIKTPGRKAIDPNAVRELTYGLDLVDDINHALIAVMAGRGG